MGESERYIDYKHLKKNRPFSLGSSNNAAMALIIINLVFFMLLLLFKVIYNFYHETNLTYYNDLVTRFVMPHQWSVLFKKPWTLITHMFAETIVLRLISNMIWLYAFGKVLQLYTGSEKLFPVYIYGGLSSALFFCIAGMLSVFPEGQAISSDLFGAGPAVMAVAAATTILAKEHRLFTNSGRGIPILVVFVLFVVVDILGLLSKPWVYTATHLIGGLTGAAFAWLLRSGYDAGKWMNLFYHRISNLFTPKQTGKNRELKEKLFYNTQNKPPFSKKPTLNQQRIDQILDKINAHGMDALTAEEKDILNQAAADGEA
jgi:membrane associated rhomboid family serine protease